MKAITLWRPWAQCFALPEDRKDIENRNWPIPNWAVGIDIAIHSGKHWDKDGDKFLRTVGINGRCYYFRDDNCTPGQIIAVVRFGPAVKESNSGWFSGPYGWPVTMIWSFAQNPTQALCDGKQGIWELPREVDRLVRAQMKIATFTRL